MANSDKALFAKIVDFKAGMAEKIEKANRDLSEIKFKFKTN